jgi:exodeoxyribonuclease V gamma subunit
MRDVTLLQLDRFLRHPIRYFVNSRLQVYLREEEPEEDEELFGLDGLQSFFLKQRLVDDRLQGEASSRRQLSAEGALPHGAFAGLVFEQESEKVASLVERLQDYTGHRPEQVPVDLELDGNPGPRRLAGQVDGIYPELGLLRWKPSSLKGPDILSLWLGHLAWCAAGELGGDLGGDQGEKRSALYTTGETFVIRESLEPDLARTHLARYLSWYWEGVHRPLLLLPKASYAYALKRYQGGSADPMRAARGEWNGNSFREIPGDRDDAYIQLVTRGLSGDPLESDSFTALSDEFYRHALSSGELL